MLALGDDLDLQITNTDDADVILKEYWNIGIDVSKLKTSISFGQL